MGPEWDDDDNDDVAIDAAESVEETAWGDWWGDDGEDN
jgi:hypothetical protein